MSQTLSEVKSKWSVQSGRYSTKWCPIPHNKCYSGTCVVLILLGGTRLHYTHMRVHLKRIQMTFCCWALPLWLAMAMTGICFNSSEISPLCALRAQKLNLQIRHAAAASFNWAPPHTFNGPRCEIADNELQLIFVQLPREDPHKMLSRLCITMCILYF